ncbi:TIGR02444 family protein [Hyphococcus flavus]|uniref:TIGR02444 family protein n=1 Tax=Hyphococcus flavus TaxID=1866326 RepID=A0AAF0CBN6_9PROT|nr:TIGR02444 family protein [Hyphococcus flavus]WDI31435.1 TIGR02444 family protein [Hyphococcus flavus]
MTANAENPFWRWSLDIYGRKPIEQQLLNLQDQCGFDVNIILWCCWLAAEGKALTASSLGNAIEAKREWTAEVIHPLRATRRYLKSVQYGGTNEDIARLRNHIKAAELDAEKHVQNVLFERSDIDALPAQKNKEKQAFDHLTLYAKLLGAYQNPAFSEDLLHILVDNVFEQ